MFLKSIFLYSLLVVICGGAPSDEDFDTLIKQVFGPNHPTFAALTQEANLEVNKPLSSGKAVDDTLRANDVLDDKVDTIIDRIFGKNKTNTEEPSPETGSDVDKIIKQIFEPSKNQTTTVKPLPAELSEPKSCTKDDGQRGICMKYYLCNEKNAILTDGKNQVDIRKRRSIPDRAHSRFRRDERGECYSYLDSCCLLQDESGNPITKKPDTKEQGCGWRNSDGVKNFTSGKESGKTKFGEFPWMCAIIKIELVPDAKSGGQKIGDVYVGGGSLIHHSVVLTAAHYVASASRLRVRAGAWNANEPSSAPLPYQLREVTNIDMHDQFNRYNLFYDVALLYLSAPIVPLPNVGLVCLPQPQERMSAGTRCFATGWGKDRFGKDGKYQVVLKKVEMPVVGHATCENRLRKTRLGQFFNLHSTFMCAGGEKDSDMCKGDGGSPLSCPIESEEGRYMQSGIVAWGIGCGEPDIPGVYVDVATFRTWIDEKVTKRGYDPKSYSV